MRADPMAGGVLTKCYLPQNEGELTTGAMWEGPLVRVGGSGGRLGVFFRVSGAGLQRRNGPSQGRLRERGKSPTL